jgi:hypothetical protein
MSQFLHDRCAGGRPPRLCSGNQTDDVDQVRLIRALGAGDFKDAVSLIGATKMLGASPPKQSHSRR